MASMIDEVSLAVAVATDVRDVVDVRKVRKVRCECPDTELYNDAFEGSSPTGVSGRR